MCLAVLHKGRVSAICAKSESCIVRGSEEEEEHNVWCPLLDLLCNYSWPPKCPRRATSRSLLLQAKGVHRPVCGQRGECFRCATCGIRDWLRLTKEVAFPFVVHVL